MISGLLNQHDPMQIFERYRMIKLTEREKDIAELLVEGFTEKEIANMLFLAPSTINTYVGKLYTKYRVDNKIKLFRKLLKEGSVTV